MRRIPKSQRPETPNHALQVANFFLLEQTVKHKEQDVDDFRDGLRTAARTLETLRRTAEPIGIRFLKAAQGTADPGTPAEAALETIPTTTASSLPETLGIRSFAQGGTDGLQLLVAYEPYSLEPGDMSVLQYKRLDVDADWLERPYDASGNAIGPFQVGERVRVRTKVSNSSDPREGSQRQLTLIAPPV